MFDIVLKAVDNVINFTTYAIVIYIVSDDELTSVIECAENHGANNKRRTRQSRQAGKWSIHIKSYAAPDNEYFCESQWRDYYNYLFPPACIIKYSINTLGLIFLNLQFLVS